jgi:hypothetical protein
VNEEVKGDERELLLSGEQSNELRAKASQMFLRDDQDADEGSSAAEAHAARMPNLVMPAMHMPGRSRASGFWISAVVPEGTRYIVDSEQLLGDPGQWPHGMTAGDNCIPFDGLLVVVGPKDADQIRKAMATWKKLPHPSWVAARIIDEECRKDPALAERMKWRVA